MYNSVVIGGGFFGCLIASRLSKRHGNTLLIESEGQILNKASKNNQARVHGGYHYPRSYLTARRSRANFKEFTHQFPLSIFESYKNIYAVARKYSHITAGQFEQFCKRIDAPTSETPKEISELFDTSLTEKTFLTQEVSFNWQKLSEYCLNELSDHKVNLRLNTAGEKLTSNPNGTLVLELVTDGLIEKVPTKSIYICTYSNLNQILRNSLLPTIALDHELTEMAVIEPPSLLRDIGITVMDGPFWSFMPFPASGFHTLSHVRYTPHYSWSDVPGGLPVDQAALNKRTNFPKMIADASRYVPSIRNSTYKDSIWETKTILPRSFNNDSRPILFQRNFPVQNLNLVLGGKIDNIFDILREI